jgi:CheY-like chemotaxis protein
MSGLDATRELRRLESLGIIPPQRIIALTGNAREAQIQNALAAGMDEVVVREYYCLGLFIIWCSYSIRPSHIVYRSYWSVYDPVEPKKLYSESICAYPIEFELLACCFTDNNHNQKP